MKKLFALYVIPVALVFGLASPAFAQHCDVKKNDSMWKISKRYHVNFHDVLELNKKFKNQNLIHPRDEVELPDGSSGSNTSVNSNSDNVSLGKSELSESGETGIANDILSLVNEERTKRGLSGLTLSSKLSSVATIKSKDMAVNNYFSHQSPTYGSPFEMLQQFGISYKSAGENIAAGQKSAEAVMNDWMNSSGHRANILSKNYTQLGVGYATGGSYGSYWCQEFIGR